MVAFEQLHPAQDKEEQTLVGTYDAPEISFYKHSGALHFPGCLSDCNLQVGSIAGFPLFYCVGGILAKYY